MTTKMSVIRDLRTSVKIGNFSFMHNLYEVNLGKNSIVAYQKLNTIGIGFHYEPVSSNMSLPYAEHADEIADHIKFNAGSIPKGVMLRAIRMIQDAIDEDQMNGIFNMRPHINYDFSAQNNHHKQTLIVQDCMENGAFIIDTVDHSVCYQHMGKNTDSINLKRATLSEVMDLGKMMNPRFEQFPGSVYELASHAMYAYLTETGNNYHKDVERLTNLQHRGDRGE